MCSSECKAHNSVVLAGTIDTYTCSKGLEIIKRSGTLESKLKYEYWRRVSKWQVNFNIKFAILAFAIIEEMAFARISLQIPYSFILPAILLGKTVLRYVFEAAWSKFWKSSLEKFSCYWKYWKKFFKSQMTLLWHVRKS